MPDRNRIINLIEGKIRARFDERLESGRQRSSLSERDMKRFPPQERPCPQRPARQTARTLRVARSSAREGHAGVARLLAPLERTRND